MLAKKIAPAAIVALREALTNLYWYKGDLIQAHDSLFDEQKRMEERRRKAHEEMLRTTAVQTKLEELTKEYFKLLGSEEPQQRGYRLEKIIRALFDPSWTVRAD